MIKMQMPIKTGNTGRKDARIQVLLYLPNAALFHLVPQWLLP